MASTVLVYEALKKIANKEQKGYITSDVFNTFAEIAQLNVFNEIFSELIDAKKLSRQGFELGRDKSIRKQRLEDLARFTKREVIMQTDFMFLKPVDLAKIISIRVINNTLRGYEMPGSQASAIGMAGNASTDSGIAMTPCELVYDLEKANYILGSNLSTPTLSFPIAIVAEQIEVFPSVVTEVELTYYRTPGSIGATPDYVNGELPTRYLQPSKRPPHLAMSQSGQGGDMYSYSGIRNFELPDHYAPELVAEIAKLMGIRLRDPNLSSYGAKEEAAK